MKLVNINIENLSVGVETPHLKVTVEKPNAIKASVSTLGILANHNADYLSVRSTRWSPPTVVPATLRSLQSSLSLWQMVSLSIDLSTITEHFDTSSNKLVSYDKFVELETVDIRLSHNIVLLVSIADNSLSTIDFVDYRTEFRPTINSIVEYVTDLLLDANKDDISYITYETYTSINSHFQYLDYANFISTQTIQGLFNRDTHSDFLISSSVDVFETKEHFSSFDYSTNLTLHVMSLLSDIVELHSDVHIVSEYSYKSLSEISTDSNVSALSNFHLTNITGLVTNTLIDKLVLLEYGSNSYTDSASNINLSIILEDLSLFNENIDLYLQYLRQYESNTSISSQRSVSFSAALNSDHFLASLPLISNSTARLAISEFYSASFPVLVMQSFRLVSGQVLYFSDTLTNVDKLSLSSSLLNASISLGNSSVRTSTASVLASGDAVQESYFSELYNSQVYFGIIHPF